MNRIVFMKKLEALLRNVSDDERKEAIQYYNDYFDDAGIENEEEVIKDLGSPEKVAATIKAGLKGQGDEFSEFRETGYTDTRFEEKDSPARRGETEQKKSGSYGETGYQSGYGDTGYNAGYDRSSKPKTEIWKVIAIILLAIVAAPVIVPVGFGIVVAIFGIAVGVFAVFIAFVAAMACVVIVGIILFGVGIPALFASPAGGLGLMGAGMITFVIGLLGSVLTIKLCMVVFPPMVRFIVELIRKPFHKKGAAA